jgi:hypothetical protein
VDNPIWLVRKVLAEDQYFIFLPKKTLVSLFLMIDLLSGPKPSYMDVLP